MKGAPTGAGIFSVVACARTRRLSADSHLSRLSGPLEREGAGGLHMGLDSQQFMPVHS